MAITLRLTKGIPLTHAELDTNFTTIEALIAAAPTETKNLLIAEGYVEGMYDLNTDFNAAGNVVYKGEATPGTATSAALWRISKTTVNAEGDSVKLWAGGAADFNQVWDNRLTLTYGA